MYTNLKKLTYAQSISTALRMSIGGFNALYLLSLGITLSQLAVLQIVFSATVLISETPSGVLSDKWNRKYMVIVGTLLCAFFYYIMFSFHTYEWFIIAEIIYALGLCFISGSFEGWVSEQAKNDGVNYYEVSHDWVSLGGLFSVLSGIISILIAYYTGSFQLLYIIVSVLFIVPILLLILTPYEKPYEINKNNATPDLGIFKTIILLLNNNIFIKYILMISVFTGSMQVIFHFWQPLFFGNNQSNINEYNLNDGVLLMILYGAIFFVQFLSNKKYKDSKNSSGLCSRATMLCSISLLLVIYFMHFSEQNKFFSYAAMLAFILVHGTSSLIPSRLHDYFSKNTNQKNFGMAFSLSESLARITSILVLYLVSLIIDDVSIEFIFFIPMLGFVLLNLILKKHFQVTHKAII